MLHVEEYAIYLRKSRKDLELEAMGQGETLARHKTALLELAKKKELKIAKIYEEVVSGESIDNRPQMQELLDAVVAGKYRGVLVMEIERLARGNTRDQGEVSEAFWGSGTLIVTPTKTYDPTNEFDEEYFEFGLFMSRREYKTIRRRMERGIAASVNEGNYLGSHAPFGYDIVRLNKKERTLKPNEQSKYVEMIFNWFVNDRLSCGEIARKLTLMGVPTRDGRPEWHRSTIQTIIHNDLYTGKIRWFRRKSVKCPADENGKRPDKRVYTDAPLIVPGKHPAIISQDLFDKAQLLVDKTVPLRFGNELKNPLSGLIFCKHCGKAIIYHGYNSRPGTSPRMLHVESMFCKVKSSTYDEVLNMLIGGLRERIDNFKVEMQNDSIIKRQEEHRNEIESMKNELSSLEKKRVQLFDYLERGIYNENEFLDRKAVYTDRIEKLKSTIATREQAAPDNINYEQKIFQFTNVIESLQNPDVSPKEKNDLLKEIISRIEYDCEDLGKKKGGKVTLDIFLC